MALSLAAARLKELNRVGSGLGNSEVNCHPDFVGSSTTPAYPVPESAIPRKSLPNATETARRVPIVVVSVSVQPVIECS